MAHLLTLCCLWQLYDLFWDLDVINAKDAMEIVYITFVHCSINKVSTFNHRKGYKMDSKIVLFQSTLFNEINNGLDLIHFKQQF